MPIAIGNQYQVNEIVKYVDEIYQCIIEDKHEKTADLESKIDELVCKLYDLTDEEIKIIDGSTK